MAGAALVVVLLSCGREPTAPQTRDVAPGIARGFSFSTVFPQLAGSSAFADLVDFNRVHILLHRVDRTVALDTTVTFPAGAASLTLSLDIRLAPGTPATGELLSLDLAYLNAAGAVVFTGGPVSIVAVPSVAGAPPPPPVSVPVVYTGPGSTARTVRISPRTLAVNTGAPFVFSAVGIDAAGAPVTGTPIFYTVLDSTRATLASSTAGTGTALGVRGTARIVAQLFNGAADTATLTINPVASAIAAVSGNGQSGIVGKPTPRTLAQPLVVRVTAADGLGVAGVAVTFAADNGGSVTPATATTDANGNAQAAWTLGPTALSQTVTASAAGLTGSPVTFSATGTLLPATRLSLSSGPTAGSSIAAGTPIGVVVTAVDADGDLVSSFTGTVNVGLSTNPSGGTLAGTSSVSAVAGVASFPTLTIIKPGTGYALQATSGSLTAVTTPSFNIVPGAAASLVLLSGGGQTSAAGSTLAPLTALVTDVNGNAKAGVTVAFAVASGGGTVTPASAVTDASGHAVATWTLGSLVGAQTLGIASAGVPSVTVNATAFSALQTWVITQQPSASLVAGSAIAPALVAELHNAVNARVTGFNGSASVSIGTNPGEATLGGTAMVTAVNGVATFSGLTLNKAGVGYTLTVNSTGAAAGTTTPFSVTAGAASVLSITSGNAQSAAVGTALSQPIVALVTDANGNAAAGVALSFAVAAGGGSVTPATATTDSTGHASTTWTLGATVGTQSLNVTSSGLPTVSVSATGTSAVVSWVITAQPGASQTAGAAVTPGLVAELHNASGALVSTFNGTVALALGANPGNSALGGTLSVTAVNGVATFTTPTLNKVGTGYTLVVSSTGATSGTTNPFNVVPAAAATLSLQSGGAQSGSFGSVLAAPLVALVVDAFQNPVAGTTVTFAVAAGGGSVGTPSATTNASGLASSTWTLGASGAQTVTIASAGLTGSPLSVGANTGSGTITQTVVSPQRDTVTALGLTRQLSAQAKDAAGANVAGSYSWVSRGPSVATVSSTGLVTAVANGSVYLVATEAGGTRDSAQIVVQQRVASVLVTPGARSLYAGAGFTYVAQAVDGNNRAMVTQPTFTWSSTVPSAATVNATTGVVAAVAIGSTQIRATSGTFVGVSNLTVITPITRIDVSFDSTNAPAAEVVSLPALGFGRAYRAVAHDTIGNVMTGISFAWQSTNTSVALVDTAQATRAHVTAAANGTTAIQATAQGVTGAATLNVAQVLTEIDLQPAALTVAVNGTSSLVARGKDANHRFIAGGTFAYSSSAPSIVTVGTSSGLVTGVANGSANLTATSGAITSNTAVVTVNNSGAAIISFGRDTIGVGRGSTLSVPILLSKPNAVAVTVNLAVADTFAFWSAASVTIPAGSTSANATLNGRNAGTTRITALDGSGTGFRGDTAVVNVQANMHIVTGGTLNLGDQYSTQVILSDPSPPGGTYVTFAYGTTGKVSVSPDPAFIPAGQLAANLVISGIAVGSSTITPVATGVTGTSVTVSVLASQLTLPYTSLRLGAGQFDQYQYVQVPTYLRNPLVVNLASSDSTVALTPPSVTIGSGQYYNYFQVTARNVGAASIFATATGWGPDTLFVTSTTPRLRASGSTALNVTSPATTVSIYSADSASYAHPRVNSLAVRVTSSDSTVMRVIDTLVTIPAGQYYVPGGARVIPGGSPGSAYIRVTASGHLPDSTRYTVSGPSLYFSWTINRLGVGQEEPYDYVQIPNPIATPLIVTISNSDSSKAATEQTVTIPAGQYYQYFKVRGKSTGSSTLIASASGYTPDTAATIVTTPRVAVSGGYTIPVYSTSSVQGYVGDSIPNYHNRTTALAVAFRSSNPSVMTVDTLETIQAGTYYTQQGATVTALSPGTAWIVASAPGHRPDSVQWTVQPAKLSLSFYNYSIGRRQASGVNDFYASIPVARAIAVPVTLTRRTNRVQTSVAVDTILANQSYRYFGLTALSAGVDTLIATAPGYLPDTGYIVVTSPRLASGGVPATANTTSPPAAVYLYAQDSLGNYHYAADTVTIHAVSSNPSVLQPDSAYFHLVKGQYSASTRIIYAGAGSASITYSDSVGGYAPVTTNSVTITGPALAIAGGTGMLGMRQQTSNGQYYVYAPNNVGTPLVVNLLSTGTRVATVPATVTIPANSYYAYFTITAQDTVGTIQIQATATGYTATSVNMQVTPPKFTLSVNTLLNTTSAPSTFYVYATDANGNYHQTAENVTVTLASSAPGVATIDSTTVTIPSGQYYSGAAKWVPVAVGTAQLTATDSRAVYYQYASAAAAVTVQTPTASLSFSGLNLAVGQYADESVSLPDYRTADSLIVPLGHAAVARTTTPSTVTVPINSYYKTFRVTGTVIGVDTITASPPGHNPASGVVNVGLGRLDGIANWPASLAVGDSALVTMYSRDPTTTPRSLAAATTFALSPNANIKFVSGGTTSATLTSVVIPADQYYVQFYVKGVSSGPGTASITNANYTTYTNTVSVP